MLRAMPGSDAWLRDNAAGPLPECPKDLQIKDLTQNNTLLLEAFTDLRNQNQALRYVSYAPTPCS